MASVDHEVRDIQGSLEDTGVTRLIPVPCSLACLEAEPEKTDVMKRPKSLELMQDDLQQEEEEVRASQCLQHLSPLPPPPSDEARLCKRRLISAAAGETERGCGLKEGTSEDATGHCCLVRTSCAGCSYITLATPTTPSFLNIVARQHGYNAIFLSPRPVDKATEPTGLLQCKLPLSLCHHNSMVWISSVCSYWEEWLRGVSPPS